MQVTCLNKLSELEEEQQTAAALEDFEKADSLNSLIDSLKDEIASIKSSTIEMKHSISNLVNQIQLNRNHQVTEFVI